MTATGRCGVEWPHVPAVEIVRDAGRIRQLKYDRFTGQRVDD
jgi:hypothetical protein